MLGFLIFFQDSIIYTVEFPLFKHKFPKVVEAELREIKNLKVYDVFEEIVDEG